MYVCVRVCVHVHVHVSGVCEKRQGMVSVCGGGKGARRPLLTDRECANR